MPLNRRKTVPRRKATGTGGVPPPRPRWSRPPPHPYPARPHCMGSGGGGGGGAAASAGARRSPVCRCSGAPPARASRRAARPRGRAILLTGVATDRRRRRRRRRGHAARAAAPPTPFFPIAGGAGNGCRRHRRAWRNAHAARRRCGRVGHGRVGGAPTPAAGVRATQRAACLSASRATLGGWSGVAAVPAAGAALAHVMLVQYSAVYVAHWSMTRTGRDGLALVAETDTQNLLTGLGELP